jgi:hypothetical protein
MNTQHFFILGLTISITLGSLLTWQLTGGDYYTKFEVVEEIEKTVDPNDPLANAGFYDNESIKETVMHKEFRFGLIPTPSGLFDKHLISVVSIVLPTWVISLFLFWKQKRVNSRYNLKSGIIN